MVAQPASSPSSARPPRADHSSRLLVVPLDPFAGFYDVRSASTAFFYRVQLVHCACGGTGDTCSCAHLCTCAAGQRQFAGMTQWRHCKHVRAARRVARSLATLAADAQRQGYAPQWKAEVLRRLADWRAELGLGRRLAAQAAQAVAAAAFEQALRSSPPAA